MNRTFLLLLSFVALCLAVPARLTAQCTNMTQFPTSAVNIAGASCTPRVITDCNYAGDYARITGIVANQTYRFTSSVAGDFLTVRESTSNGTSLGTGTTTVTVTPATNADLFLHVNTSMACGTQQVCRRTTVQCTTCSAVTPACPALLTPDNNATGVSTLPTFTWQTSANAVSYDVYVQQMTGGCGSTAGAATLVGSVGALSNQTTASLTATTYLNTSTTYRWYVIPRDCANMPVSSCSTAIFCFTTGAPAPANNECIAALTLTVSDNGTCSTTLVSTTGATQSAGTISCGTAGENNDDVWYTFTAARNGVYIFRYSNLTATSGTVSGLSLDVYNNGGGGTCTNLVPVSDACRSNFAAPQLIYLAAGNYYLRLFTAGTGNSANFNFCIEAPYAVPANDDCIGAFPFTLSANGACAYTSVSTVGASSSIQTPSCVTASSNNDDVWLTFQTGLETSGNQVNLSYTLRFSNLASLPGLTTATGIGYALYTGACGLLVQAGCVDEVPSTGNAGSTTLTLLPGTNYYLRLWLTGANNMGTFQLCIEAPSNARPANDDCLTALPFLVSPGGACTYLRVSTAGATQSGTAPSCANGNPNNDDVWFSFVPTVSGNHKINYQNIAITGQSPGTTGNSLGFQIYTANCANLTNSTVGACISNIIGNGSMATSGTSTITVPLTGGTVYLLRIWATGNQDYASFDLCIEGPTGGIPANDNCANAFVVVANSGSFCIQSTLASTVSASATANVAACQGNPDDDVWFRFTPSAATQTITVTPTLLGGLSDAVLQVFADGCTAANTLACVNATTGASAETVTISGLSTSTQYYLRVYSFASASGTGAFNVCITTPPAQTFVSIVTTQRDLTPVQPNSLNNEIVRMEINVVGASNPLTVQQILFDMTGTTEADDVTAARVYYTGTSPTLSTATQFGATIINPSGTLTFMPMTGQTLTGGNVLAATYYFFLVYDVSPTAEAGHVLDAQGVSVTINGITRLPLITNPPGSRPIVSALPITLLYFRGSVADAGNLLEWATASEQDAAWFVIERSADGVSGWQEVGRTQAAGNSSGERRYTLTDATPPDLAYYRLRSIDVDGAEQLSPIIRLQRDATPRLAVVAVYPAPVNDLLTVQFEAPADGNLTLRMTDLAGRVVREMPVPATGGANVLQLPVGQLPVGVYLLQLIGNTGPTAPVRVIRQ